jgi:hypothetical protein
MLKKVAFISACVIAVVGVSFIALDILDIAEDYRLHLPIAILNTVFIVGVAVPVAILAARTFLDSGVPAVIGLGGGALAFGTGILVYSWFGRSVLEVRLTVYDSAVLMAAIIHLCGVIFLKLGLNASTLKTRPKQAIALLYNLVIIGIVVVVTWLLYREVLPTLIVTRGTAHAISAVLSVAAAVICLKNYLRVHAAFYYWYSLGLVLFALGVIFVGEGALESRIVWLGRLSQYLGGIYFLVAVLGVNRRARDGGLG